MAIWPMCEACGSPKVAGSMGAVYLCRRCQVDIEAETRRLHAEGKTVNVMHIARRIYREQYAGGDYLLRDIPRELWERAQARSAEERASLREIILIALRDFLEKPSGS